MIDGGEWWKVNGGDRNRSTGENKVCHAFLKLAFKVL